MTIPYFRVHMIMYLLYHTTNRKCSKDERGGGGGVVDNGLQVVYYFVLVAELCTDKGWAANLLELSVRGVAVGIN